MKDSRTFVKRVAELSGVDKESSVVLLGGDATVQARPACYRLTLRHSIPTGTRRPERFAASAWTPPR
jgi:hypothetical protein